MRIGLYTWGSEGDVRPFLALAVGLAEAGHDVRLSYVAVDGRDYGSLAAPFGIDALSVGAEAIAHARASGRAADDALAGRGNPLEQVKTILEHLLDPAVDAMWEDAAGSIPDCDVAVVHMLHHPAASLAIRHRVPIVAVTPIPMQPTRALPPVGAPSLGPLNRLAWWAVDRFGKGWFLTRVNASRARAGVPLETTMFPRPSRAALTLTCASPTLVPRPADWDAEQRIPGFFELPPTHQGWTMPEELRAFLDAGPPPVLMGFGSMLAIPSDDTRECVRVMLAAARLSGCRALVQAPFELVPDAAPSPDVFRLGRAPHALVLPRCAAFVHHGGAGTAHTAALAGTPSVMVPFLADQFFWAERLRALGVAKAPLPRRALDAAALARRIRAIVEDPRPAARAREVAATMAPEDGVRQAVRWIEDACVHGRGASDEQANASRSTS